MSGRTVKLFRYAELQFHGKPQVKAWDGEPSLFNKSVPERCKGDDPESFIKSAFTQGFFMGLFIADDTEVDTVEFRVSLAVQKIFYNAVIDILQFVDIHRDEPGLFWKLVVEYFLEDSYIILE